MSVALAARWVPTLLVKISDKEKDAEASDFTRLVDYRWNHIYESLMLMYTKLDKFGLKYCGGEIVILEEL